MTDTCLRCGMPCKKAHATADHCIDALRERIARYEIKGPPQRAGFSRVTVHHHSEIVLLDGQEMELPAAAERLQTTEQALFFRIYRKGKIGTKPDLREIDADKPGNTLTGEKWGNGRRKRKSAVAQ